MTKLLPQRIVVVLPTTLRDTGRVSFAFKYRGVPLEKCRDLPRPWGCLKLENKTPDHLDPFKLALRLPGAVGNDGVKRWNLHLFDNDRPVLAGGVNEDPETQDSALSDLLEGAPDCVLLMSRQILPRFEAFCQAEGIDLEVILYEGELPTS